MYSGSNYNRASSFQGARWRHELANSSDPNVIAVAVQCSILVAEKSRLKESLGWYSKDRVSHIVRTVALTKRFEAVRAYYHSQIRKTCSCEL